jgi:hypothetical protein
MKKLILLFLFTLSSLLTFATHIRGGYISVKRIGVSRTCEIKVNVFTDIGCSNCVLFGGELDVLNFGDGTQMLVPETQSSPFPGVPNVGVASYTVLHTFPGNGRYTISYREPNRNAGVLNIDNAVNTTFYTETQIDLSVFNNYHSPTILVPFIDEACTGVAFSFNAGAYDLDGDSLSYELVEPFSDRNTAVQNYRIPNDPEFYAGLNYNQANEEKNGSPTFSIHPTDGTLTWDAPGSAGEYAVAFVIREWRRIGRTEMTSIGFVRVDRQIIVNDCDNDRPRATIPNDICVVAGSTINASIEGVDSDNDSVKIEMFSEIFDFSDASVQPSPSVFQLSNPPAEVQFTWNTTCDDTRNQPYMIVVRITDKPPLGQPLVTYKAWRINVIAPSPILQSANVDLPNRQVELTWDAYTCQNAIAMEVWRKVDDTDFIPDSCQSGIPEHLGFSQVASLPIKDDLDVPITTFIDTNLAVGAKYCYRLVAIFPLSRGGESYVSNGLCLDPILGMAPVITNVSVDKTSHSGERTSHTDGEIEIRWTPPLNIDAEQYPGPYEYLVQRGNASEFINVSSKISDTTFIDTGLETNSVQYFYRILLFSSSLTDPIDTSSVASSTLLELTPLESKVKLVWSADVPWSNQIQGNPMHLIYRGDAGATENDLVLIDSVNVTQEGLMYMDEGLAPGNSYCYRIMTRGGYGNSVIAEPLINFSEIVCATPLVVGLENESSISVQIFPNPAQQFLRIEFTNESPLEILFYDQQGKLQLKQTLTQTTDVDVRDFVNGLYYCVIRNGAKPVSRVRIVKN